MMCLYVTSTLYFDSASRFAFIDILSQPLNSINMCDLLDAATEGDLEKVSKLNNESHEFRVSEENVKPM